jgi:parallel beta-helix repeat protein
MDKGIIPVQISLGTLLTKRKISHRWRITIPLIISLSIFAFLYISLPSSNPGRAAVGSIVSGNIITHTTWLATESPYVVTEDVTVDPGIILTIEPDVTVAFDGSYAIHIQGSLVAIGTETQPIQFTSNQNDPAAGDWGMLDFRSESDASIMEHTIVEYGGNDTRSGVGCKSGALCVSTPSFKINKSLIQHNANRGVILVQTNAEITNNTFNDNGSEAIEMPACDHYISDCRPIIANNTFTNHDRAILRQGAFDPFMQGNQANDNGINGIVMQQNASFDGQNHWYANDLPYVVQYAVTVGHPLAPAHLTIDPGTVVKFDAGSALTFAYSAVLTATGKSDQPITFTSIKDDSIGGDTNNDGETTAPAPGDWNYVTASGAGVSVELSQTAFYYGGGWASAPAILGLDIDCQAIIKDIEVSHSARHGIYVWRGADAIIEDSIIHDNGKSGIEISTDGEVIIRSNHILDNAENGIYVYSGHPQVSDNFFQGNPVGVDINCNPISGTNCEPVISPHNSFPVNNERGIVNNYPLELCVEARFNWWGDIHGPADSSSQQDACGLVDNLGSGINVSDGVDYSPWEGGVARPIIAHPTCGLTAINQPVFSGRSQADAEISFFDGESLLGQTTAAADHTFNWLLPEPLSDGQHTITALATLGGETSLPSQELPITVDSTLPFDPAGIRITYAYHDILLTQTLKDSNGCAAIKGDLDTSLWVRPDSTLTVTIPIRKDMVPGNFVQTEIDSATRSDQSASDNIHSGDETIIKTITNASNQKITGISVAVKEPGFGDGVFQPYKKVDDFLPMDPGDTRTMNFTADTDVLFTTDFSDHIVDRVMIDPADTSDFSIESDAAFILSIGNDSQHDIEYLYVKGLSQTDEKFFGGSLINPENPLKTDGYYDVVLPLDSYYIILRDDKNSFYMQLVSSMELLFNYDIVSLDLDPWTYGVNFEIQNDGTSDICEVRIVSYREGEQGIVPFSQIEQMPNILNFFGFDPITKNGGSISFKINSGRYYLEAKDCNGKVVFNASSLEIWDDTTIHIGQDVCTTIGAVKVGNIEYPIKCPYNLNSSSASTAVWAECYSIVDAIAETLSLDLCVNGSLWDLLLALILIDPDGYVYDSSKGIETVIQGATVTCDMYDEDYQTWERWPAELFESQVNPQVTGPDGYYAFFVPSGLYRVNATAFGYDPHTSPDIRVIDEIVHYNIPMQGDGVGGLFLPYVVR